MQTDPWGAHGRPLMTSGSAGATHHGRARMHPERDEVTSRQTPRLSAGGWAALIALVVIVAELFYVAASSAGVL